MNHSMKLSPGFLPIINLSSALVEAITRGDFPIRAGQWVKLNKRRGQVINVRDKILYVSWSSRPGETFDGRTQRFHRAVRHHHQGHNVSNVRQVA